ncbi:hypothetical protein ACFX11_008795 [Malus domestica]
MKDGRHMLSGEDGTTSSSRFKSKRRSEGPDIFKVLKEEEIGQIKILEVQEGSFHKQKFKCALKRTACLYKKQHSTGFQRSKRRAQNSKRPFKNRRSHSKIEEASSEIGEASCFSRRVGTRHTQTQLCGNHGWFVETPIPDIEEALVFSALSAPVTRKLSFAEITGNLLKRQSQISKRRQSFQPRQHPSRANSALRKSRVICRSANPRYRRSASLFQPRQHLSHARSA